MTEIGYYPGCSLKGSSKLYDIQSRKVFKKLGIELRELDDWNCCGATSAAKTDDFMATAMPARNLGIAEASGLSEIIIPCSACYSRMLLSQNALQEDQNLRDEINEDLLYKVAGNINIMSILEPLCRTVESGAMKEKVVKSLKGLNPACYYGCLQTRFPGDIPIQDSIENPQGMENILKVLGIKKPLDWGYKTDCCGASSSVCDADASIRLMSGIMKDAVARKANCFVTTCPFCQLNLDAYQNQFCEKYGIEERLPVFFITELIGIAMGMDAKELQIDRHFIDAIRLLKELELI